MMKCQPHLGRDLAWKVDTSTLSVIIPVLNEEGRIKDTIESVKLHKPWPEVVVVDGGSKDRTVAIAKSLGVQVVSSKPGRAVQLNHGWRVCTGKWCLFLHGDTQLPGDYLQLINKAHDRWVHRCSQPLWRSWWWCQRAAPVASSEPLWGCFRSINPQLPGWGNEVLRTGVRLRTCLLGRPYGDQALWVKRETLEQLGGYKEWPLLEDLDLVLRLKASGAGPPAIADCDIATSGRRWEQHGFWRTTALNQAVLLGWWAGVDVSTLAQWYKNARLVGSGRKD